MTENNWTSKLYDLDCTAGDLIIHKDSKGFNSAFICCVTFNQMEASNYPKNNIDPFYIFRKIDGKNVETVNSKYGGTPGKFNPIAFYKKTIQYDNWDSQERIFGGIIFDEIWRKNKND